MKVNVFVRFGLVLAFVVLSLGAFPASVQADGTVTPEVKTTQIVPPVEPEVTAVLTVVPKTQNTVSATETPQSALTATPSPADIVTQDETAKASDAAASTPEAPIMIDAPKDSVVQISEDGEVEVSECQDCFETGPTETEITKVVLGSESADALQEALDAAVLDDVTSSDFNLQITSDSEYVREDLKEGDLIRITFPGSNVHFLAVVRYCYFDGRYQVDPVAKVYTEDGLQDEVFLPTNQGYFQVSIPHGETVTIDVEFPGVGHLTFTLTGNCVLCTPSATPTEPPVDTPTSTVTPTPSSTPVVSTTPNLNDRPSKGTPVASGFSCVGMKYIATLTRDFQVAFQQMDGFQKVGATKYYTLDMPQNSVLYGVRPELDGKSCSLLFAAYTPEYGRSNIFEVGILSTDVTQRTFYKSLNASQAQYEKQTQDIIYEAKGTRMSVVRELDSNGLDSVVSVGNNPAAAFDGTTVGVLNAAGQLDILGKEELELSAQEVDFWAQDEAVISKQAGDFYLQDLTTGDVTDLPDGKDIAAQNTDRGFAVLGNNGQVTVWLNTDEKNTHIESADFLAQPNAVAIVWVDGSPLQEVPSVLGRGGSDAIEPTLTGEVVPTPLADYVNARFASPADSKTFNMWWLVLVGSMLVLVALVVFRATRKPAVVNQTFKRAAYDAMTQPPTYPKSE